MLFLIKTVLLHRKQQNCESKMMGLKLKQLKQINNKTRNSVFGYVRRIEKNNKLSSAIPDMISYLCLQYYSHGEYFKKSDKNIKITNERMTIERKVRYAGFADSSAFGKMLIDSNMNQIVQWTLKINLMGINNEGDACFTIGITSNAKIWHKGTKGAAYAFKDTGNTIYKYDGEVTEIDKIDYDKIKHNDEIILTLNTKKREIRYKKKNHYASFGIYCIDRKQGLKYFLALLVASPHTVVTLTDFSINNC